MRRLAWAGWVLALVAATASADRADLKLNIDVEFGWGGCYRPQQWMPVQVEIHSAEKRFPAVVTLAGRQDEWSTVTLRRPCVLVPDTPYPVPLAMRLAFGVSDCTLAVRDAETGRLWEKTYGLWDWERGKQALTPLGAADLLIVVAGQNRFGLRDLAKATHSRHVADAAEGGGSQGTVFVRDRALARLPWDWPPYGPVDLLILYDPDWTAIRGAAKEAIREWVQGGGSLLVVLGAHPLPATDPVARLLGVRLGEARELELPAETLRAWGCAAVDTRRVTAWDLQETGAFGWEVDRLGTDRPMLAWGPAGFGRVGVLAFDPAVVGGPQGEKVAPFWLAATKGLLGPRTLAAGAARDDDRRYYLRHGQHAGEVVRGTNAVLNHLMDIPEMRPISILWVVLLLAGLAVVIGPVDYLILRWKDRLPLTWLTFTCYIAAFSGLAYVGVHLLRAGATQWRSVLVWDGVAGEGGGWACGYAGIYANTSDDYRLKGLERGQWWSPAAPYQEYYGFAGSGGGLRQITCAQEDGGSLPVYLPISIWSMQCLRWERAAPPPPLAARLTAEGDRARVVVENLLDHPVAGGRVRFANRGTVRFGAVPAKGRIEVTDERASATEWKAPQEPPYEGVFFSRGPVVDPLEQETVYFADGVDGRTRALERYLAAGAAVVCAEYEDAPADVGLEGRSAATTHRLYVRLVVFPEKRSP